MRSTRAFPPHHSYKLHWIKYDVAADLAKKRERSDLRPLLTGHSWKECAWRHKLKSQRSPIPEKERPRELSLPVERLLRLIFLVKVGSSEPNSFVMNWWLNTSDFSRPQHPAAQCGFGARRTTSGLSWCEISSCSWSNGFSKFPLVGCLPEDMRLALTIVIEWGWKSIDQSVEVWNEETKSLHIIWNVKQQKAKVWTGIVVINWRGVS